MKLTWKHLAMIVLVLVIVSNVSFGCMRREGMTELSHKMGEGVHGSWDTRELPKGVSSLEWRKQNHDSYASELVKPEDGMHFFSDTHFDAKCCGSSYGGTGGLDKGGSIGTGCACMTKKQIDFINTRGGNRTNTSDF
jgi:hypothetical protein